MGSRPGTAKGNPEGTQKGTATGGGEEKHGEVVDDVAAHPINATRHAVGERDVAIAAVKPHRRKQHKAEIDKR